MRDLQRRLAAAGHHSVRDDGPTYGPGTAAAVAEFQLAHGLPSDGVCDSPTWNALVEAGYQLGERLLYHRMPMLRGDDVVELQTRLGALGFDCGRVDGIFGPLAARAVHEFQRNAGLAPDGVCGHDTVALLRRMSARVDLQHHVAIVRERESLLRLAPTVQGQRIAIGQPGTLSSLARAITRVLRRNGAEVLRLDGDDASTQAAAANAFEATAYLGVTSSPDAAPFVAYYGSPTYTSPGGERLAHELASALHPVLGRSVCMKPQRLSVLRETRMPAVVIEVGPTDRAVAGTSLIADAITSALNAWCCDPLPAPSSST